MKNYKLLFVTVFILCSCTEQMNSNKIEFKTEIQKYDDNFFINEINDIKFNDKKFYIIDANITKLFILNSDFELIHFIGNFGKGPQEYLSMGAVSISDKHIYVSDIRRNCLMCYDKSTYDFIKEISFPDNIYIPYGDFFIDDQNNVTVINVDADNQRLGFYNTEKLEFTPYDLQDKHRISDHRNIKFYGNLGNDILVALPRYSKSILLISRKENKIIEKQEVDIPKKSLMKWEAYRKKGRNTPLFTDCQLINNKVYLIFQDLANSSRGLAEIKINRNLQTKNTEIFQFPPKNGDECLCISNKEVVTFSRRKGSLQKFFFN